MSPSYLKGILRGPFSLLRTIRIANIWDNPWAKLGSSFSFMGLSPSGVVMTRLKAMIERKEQWNLGTRLSLSASLSERKELCRMGAATSFCLGRLLKQPSWASSWSLTPFRNSCFAAFSWGWNVWRAIESLLNLVKTLFRTCQIPRPWGICRIRLIPSLQTNVIVLTLPGASKAQRPSSKEGCVCSPRALQCLIRCHSICTVGKGPPWPV